MKLIRVQEVAAKCGISIATVWRKAGTDPTFPQPVRLSANVTGWVEGEVDAYLAQRIREYREQPTKRETAAQAAMASATKRAERRAAAV
jgi:prophage regulatory protein